MKFTENDFTGYSNHCDTILQIKNFIKDREFTFDELVGFKPQHVNMSSFIRYLKEDKIKPFLISQTGSENIKQQYFQALEIFDENKFLKNKIEADQNKGEVIRLLDTIWKQSFKSESYMTTNGVMQRGMYIALETFYFQENEFSEITKKYNFSYWGGNMIEYFYADAVRNNNNSAWKSIEKYLDRKPFIIKNKRMYEGKTFTMAYDEKWTVFRCTGWNEAGKIKFVTDNKNEKQKRFSFDLSEFKAFFRDQNFRDFK